MKKRYHKSMAENKTRERVAENNIEVERKTILGMIKGHYKFVHVQNNLLLSPFSQGWVFYLFNDKTSQTIPWINQYCKGNSK